MSVLRRVARLVLLLAAIVLAYCLAFAIRFDFAIPAKETAILLGTFWMVVLVRFGTLLAFRIHCDSLRHQGINELRRLTIAVTCSSGLILLALFMTQHLYSFPRSVLLLDWGIAIALIGGKGLAVRMWREKRLLNLRPAGDGRPIIIVGAGSAGARLIREAHLDHRAGLLPVALVDDDLAKRGMYLHGVPVAGNIAQVGEVARRYKAHTIVIAMPSARAQEMQDALKHCSATGLPVRVVPTLQELLDRQATLTQIREVQIEDLLGRDAVTLDLALVREQIAGRVVLITGGAGSIGSELARQVAALKPAKLVLLEQSESPLYFIHLELAGQHPDVEVIPVIADVTNRPRITEVFDEYRPAYVFHAAAYKHVPMMEHNVGEAVRNNVLGTLCVAQSAVAVGTHRFVLISSDKAVHPSSVMGATKRIAERVILGHPTLRGSATDFRAVRFGNVLGSDGSVIPLFKRQLASGGPLTVTHRDVTRYFMTIPEAVQLVLMAGSLPEAARRISMLEMGQPVKIVDLAENLIRLSGLTPGVDIKIEFTGMRPGEKLFEELMSDVEATVPTSAAKIRIVQTDETDGMALHEGVNELARAAIRGTIMDVLEAIRDLVPECVAPLRDRGEDAHIRQQPASLRAATPPPTQPPVIVDQGTLSERPATVCDAESSGTATGALH